MYAAYLAADVYLAATLPVDEFAPSAFAMSRARWLTYLSPYLRLGEFLIGVAASQCFLAAAGRPKRGGWWAGAGWLAAATGGLLGVYYLMYSSVGPATPPLWLRVASRNVLYAPLCAVIVYQLAALPCAAARRLGSGPMVTLGEASYALYLLHPLAQSFYHLRAAGEGPLTRWYIVAYNNLAMLAVMHLMALGLYRYVEVPCRTAIRDRLAPRKPRVVATPAADQDAGRQAA